MGKTIWHYINSGKCSPTYNMALDEALLEWHSKGEIGPVLRFYEWEPQPFNWLLSKLHKVIDLEEVSNLGLTRKTPYRWSRCVTRT